ncbi:Calcium-transporting ATPase 4, endoplasmic reticulum-type, partial [Ananas comosus]
HEIPSSGAGERVQWGKGGTTRGSGATGQPRASPERRRRCFRRGRGRCGSARRSSRCRPRRGSPPTRCSAAASSTLNELGDTPARPCVGDTLVRILLAAAAVSFLSPARRRRRRPRRLLLRGALVIFLILVLNAAVGVWQESNAEKALAALKEIQSEHAAVRRDGGARPQPPREELAPAMSSSSASADKVPGRHARPLPHQLHPAREQASLTGESEAVNKTSRRVDAEDSDLQGKECMLFAGTTIANGAAWARHPDRMHTEIGKIHSQIHEASQGDDDTRSRRSSTSSGRSPPSSASSAPRLGHHVRYSSPGVCRRLPRRFTSPSTVHLLLRDRRRARRRRHPRGPPRRHHHLLALARARWRRTTRSSASCQRETLGCTTVICSDKTGTLTTNQMSAVRLLAMGKETAQIRSFRVEGTTYDPADGRIHGWPAGDLDQNLRTVAKIAAVCNDASVSHSGNHFVASGMPTRRTEVEKMGLPSGSVSSSFESSEMLKCCQWWNNVARRVATLEFDRTRKSMGVIVRSSSGRNSLLVKGAVENLLERSSYIQLLDGSVVELDESSKAVILEALHEMSTNALRCLGFAYKEDLLDFATYDGEDHPAHKLLLDPLNYSSIEKEVHKAIEDCKQAGIRVIVITGDNKATAEAICREIGVFSAEEDISTKSFTGRDFMSLPDKKSKLRQKGGLLFSRAEPKHKQEIVRLLKEDGEVVAMTGDGVNDAPALKLADIGIAMGIAGTEVAKEASDMVLADDNFSTIVAAVSEGRSIYNNMKAFIRYMISSNIGEVASIFLTAALGIPEGLIPVQLLWMALLRLLWDLTHQMETL